MADDWNTVVTTVRGIGRAGVDMLKRKKRAIGPIASMLFLLAGCQIFWPNTFLNAPADPCPWQAETAKAWVNHMPGVENTRPRLLHVYVRLDEQLEPVELRRMPESTDDTLILRLAASDDKRLGLAGAAYRERTRETPYSNIIIQCHAEELARIDTIKSVW